MARPASPVSPTPPPPRSSGNRVALAGLLIVAAVAAAWAPALHAPFIFDDLASIVSNPTIRDLSDLGEVLMPHHLGGSGVAGRPVVNLSLALNHAAGGLSPFGYHLTNLLFHAAAALLLLGCVRRTLLLPSLHARWSARALPVASAAALLWAVHPLQTESVTCVIQRTELLFSLFLLLTLYCFLRSLTAARRDATWRVGAVLACGLGMATKEVMAVAPVLLLLFDRQFLARDLRTLLRERGRLHLALAATWLVLAACLALAPGREGTVGFGLGVSSWHYALTQCDALVRYLGLALWPHPLVLDYGSAVRTSLGEVLPQALLVVTLVGLSIWAVWRRLPVGFLAAWFFGLLAPSSSFVPLVTQTIAEHRMYLPLAALTVGAALLAAHLRPRVALPTVLGLALALAAATFQRNRDYESAARIWEDTVEKAPANPRARYNLGNALVARGDAAPAVDQYREAARMYRAAGATPRQLASVLLNLGAAKLTLGEARAALADIEEAGRCDPAAKDIAPFQAKALLALGRTAEATASLRRHLAASPGDLDSLYLLANSLLDHGEFPEAASVFEHCLRLRPDDPAIHSNLANALIGANRLPAAIPHLERAAVLDPNNPSVVTNLAIAHLARNRLADGRALLEQVVRDHPDYRPAFELLEQVRQMATGK